MANASLNISGFSIFFPWCRPGPTINFYLNTKPFCLPVWLDFSVFIALLSVAMKTIKLLLSIILITGTSSLCIADTVLLPLYNGLSGTISVPGSPSTSFDQGGFHVSLLVRPGTIPVQTSFYFSGSGYAYGYVENSSEVDITRIGGGAFTFQSIEQWAFQGSQNAVLIVQGYAGGVLQGEENYSLATPSTSVSSYTHQLKSASVISGMVLDKLVLFPNFTSFPLNEAGFSNLTVTTVVPEPVTSSLLLMGFAATFLWKRSRA